MRVFLSFMLLVVLSAATWAQGATSSGSGASSSPPPPPQAQRRASSPGGIVRLEDTGGPEISVSAEIGYEGREESGPGKGISQRPDSNFEVRIEPTLSFSGIRLTGLLFTTSLEEAILQARNRFRLNTEHKYAGITVGDAYNRSSEFVARGARFRGAGGYLQYAPHKVTFYYGETRRDVEGAFDSTLTRVTRFGTYQRKVGNVNLESQPVRDLTVRASAAFGEDKDSSIRFGRAPKENTAFGGEMGYVLPKRVAELLFSVGISSTETSATDFDSTAAKNDGEAAWKVGAKTVVAGHRLSGSYSRVGTDYESFAAPSLTSDRAALRLEDRFGLFRRKLQVQLGYETNHDNVDDDEDFTLGNHHFSAGAAFPLPGKLPSVRLRGSLRTSSNDAPDSTMRVVDNMVTDLSVELSRRFSLSGGGSLRPSLGLRGYRRSDDVRSSSEFSRLGLTGRADGRYKAYQGRLYISWASTDFDAAARGDRKQLDVRLDHTLTASPRLEVGADQIFSRTTLDGEQTGARLELGGRASYVVVTDVVALTGAYHYIDFSSDMNPGRDFSAHEFEIRLKTVGAVSLGS